MYFTTLIVALAASISAVNAYPPLPPSDPIPEMQCPGYVICVDGISDCGEPFGGCYDACSEPAPKPQPCPATTATPTPTPTPEDDCCTRTICIDAINECGMRYGGCIPDCKPFDLTTPLCSATTMATATVRPAN